MIYRVAFTVKEGFFQFLMAKSTSAPHIDTNGTRTTWHLQTHGPKSAADPTSSGYEEAGRQQ